MPDALQAGLTAVTRAYSRMGLSVNNSKTEVLCQWSAEPPQTPPIFSIADSPLAIVPHFRNLGSILSEDIQHRNHAGLSVLRPAEKRVIQQR